MYTCMLSYSIVVSHLSFNFLCLLLLYSIYLCALTGRFFPVYILSRLSEQFSGSQAGYGKFFRDTGGYQIVGTSSLRGLLEGIPRLVRDFNFM